MLNARRRNGWKRWTEDDLRELRELAQARLPKEMIGLRMGRSPEAVAQRAWLEGLRLPGRRPRTTTVARPHAASTSCDAPVPELEP